MKDKILNVLVGALLLAFAIFIIGSLMVAIWSDEIIALQGSGR